MEEGIKILENIAELYNECYDSEYKGCYDYKFDYRDIQAIETVLAEYKKLKLENTMLENTKNMCPIFQTSGISCTIKDKVKELEIESEVTDE